MCTKLRRWDAHSGAECDLQGQPWVPTGKSEASNWLPRYLKHCKVHSDCKKWSWHHCLNDDRSFMYRLWRQLLTSTRSKLIHRKARSSAVSKNNFQKSQNALQSDHFNELMFETVEKQFPFCMFGSSNKHDFQNPGSRNGVCVHEAKLHFCQFASTRRHFKYYVSTSPRESKCSKVI